MRIRILSLKIIVIFLFVGLGYWVALAVHKHKECGESYAWLNEQLRCTGQPTIGKTEYSALKNDILMMIDKWKVEGVIDEAAIYFRDLSNGPTMGISQYSQFVPASLLKVPLMLSYLRLAEEDPAILERELVFSEPEDDIAQTILPTEVVETGRPYKVEELLYRLIAYSDNRAWDILYNHLSEISPDRALLAETYNDLGIFEPQNSLDDIITVKSYASIFRQLYNSSYLSKEYSNKALEYLSMSVYGEGLRRGVPEKIPIAQKFGERFTNEYEQLHDCGIIYYPNNPYLLCVMTKGRNFEKLGEFIGEISAAVYQEVDSRRL